MTDTYVADAHAFAAYLADSLPSRSDRIFEASEEEECTIVIPTIALAELIYVFEKTSTESKIWDMFERLDRSPSIETHALDEEVLRKVPDIELEELHDRIIVATCEVVRAKELITKDEEIRRSGLIKTVW
ncbi:MAG TPA: type II toxin-antitoxin system VapC family toxin [Nitrososphaerales archaeon]|nr:type II toxin-antitoxin system VapC family toxin [Nitrososphaerales archaeon]